MSDFSHLGHRRVQSNVDTIRSNNDALFQQQQSQQQQQQQQHRRVRGDDRRRQLYAIDFQQPSAQLLQPPTAGATATLSPQQILSSTTMQSSTRHQQEIQPQITPIQSFPSSSSSSSMAAGGTDDFDRLGVPLNNNSAALLSSSSSKYFGIAPLNSNNATKKSSHLSSMNRAAYGHRRNLSELPPSIAMRHGAHHGAAVRGELAAADVDWQQPNRALYPPYAAAQQQPSPLPLPQHAATQRRTRRVNELQQQLPHSYSGAGSGTEFLHGSPSSATLLHSVGTPPSSNTATIGSASPHAAPRLLQRKSSLEELAELEELVAAKQRELSKRGVIPEDLGTARAALEREAEKVVQEQLNKRTSREALLAAKLDDLEDELAQMRRRTSEIVERVERLERERCRAPDVSEMRRGFGEDNTATTTTIVQQSNNTTTTTVMRPKAARKLSNNNAAAAAANNNNNNNTSVNETNLPTPIVNVALPRPILQPVMFSQELFGQRDLVTPEPIRSTPSSLSSRIQSPVPNLHRALISPTTVFHAPPSSSSSHFMR